MVEHEGKALYVLVPVEEYRELERLRAGEEPTYPHEVVERLTEGKSLVRAWREYRGLTQVDMATRLGITIPAYQRMEQPGRNLRLGTLKRLAKALEVRVDHLILDDDEDEDAACLTGQNAELDRDSILIEGEAQEPSDTRARPL